MTTIIALASQYIYHNIEMMDDQNRFPSTPGSMLFPELGLIYHKTAQGTLYYYPKSCLTEEEKKEKNY